jgi:hypothetical protein
MLHVAEDYTISSIAGSLLLDQAIKTYEMEGNLVEHLIDSAD